jgi:hypothetical protein
LPIHLRRYYLKQVQKAVDEKNKVEQAEVSKTKVPKFTKPAGRK